MCMRSYIWVDAETYVRHFPFPRSQTVDDLQLGDALHIEAEDVVVEPEIDFPVCLPHAGIDNAARREATVQTASYLASAHTVGPHSCLADYLQHLCVGIGLDGIVNGKVCVCPHFFMDRLQSLPKEVAVVIVERGIDMFELVCRKSVGHLSDLYRIVALSYMRLSVRTCGT